MRNSPRIWYVLAFIALMATGCSSTGMGRPFGSRMKTASSVADKPLPVATGDPGAAIAAEDTEPEVIDRRPKLEGKISGHVYDEQGEPAEGVVVRVAESALRGGKVVRTRTDRAGGFTLRGLRPGTDYTVIAEREDEQTLVTGRVEAQAPETGVEIELGQDEPAVVIPKSARATSRKRVASATDSEDPDRSAYSNDDDLRPGSEEGFSPSSSKSPRPSKSTSSGGWRRSGDEPDTSSATKARSVAPSAEGDDENPLPPALERTPTQELPPQASTRRRKSGELVIAPRQVEKPAVEEPLVEEAEPVIEKTEPVAMTDIPSSDAATAPAPIPASTGTDIPPGDAAKAPAPIVASTVVDTPSYDPFALVPGPDSVDTADLGPGPLQQPSVGEPRALGDVARSTREPTDGKLINKVSLSAANVSASTAAEGLTTKSPASRLRPVARSSRTLNSRTALPVKADKIPLTGDTSPVCKFDEKQGRLLDFRIIDLQGRPTRFSDFNSEYVLLDFWGSWCEPCKDSIPHLIELQKWFPPERIQIIGIACERGPVESRPVTASSAARKLKVNYPVLVADAENGDPLQQALHVQAYPTMVLLDRQGRIVWRASGATESNLARLDRILATTVASKVPTQARR